MKPEVRTEPVNLTLCDTQGKLYEVRGTQEWLRVVPLAGSPSPWQLGALRLMWGQTPVNVLEDGTYVLAHPEIPLVLA